MLIETLKADTLTARKTKAPEAAVLRTVLGTLETRGKQKNTTVDDVLAMAVIKSTLKGLYETQAALEGKGRPADTAQTALEILALERYLPKQMTETEMKAAVGVAISEGHTAIGSIMGYLKANHEGTYDGKMASQIIKQELEMNR